MTPETDSPLFDDVQRIVLKGNAWKEGGAAQPAPAWEVAGNLVLCFPSHSAPLHFLSCLLQSWPPAKASSTVGDVQVSLGFSRRGLEHARVPSHVLGCFAAKAPAFMAGAAMRAAGHAGNFGRNGPDQWDSAFGFTVLDAVLGVHALKQEALDKALIGIEALARKASVITCRLPPQQRLPAPEGHHMVHFGYRDGLSHVGINGWTPQATLAKGRSGSSHAAGEFVLGHPQDSGANRWITTVGLPDWSDELRSFFRNGSFGVLHQMEQHVADFEDFVSQTASEGKFTVDEVKAKLCGRTPDGVPLAPNPGFSGDPRMADFDYTHDPDGRACPFGSHVRRMNPRGDPLAHAGRRPILRRGMTYGKPWNHHRDNESRGMIGLFFCASIEDQFEHLLGQWGDRVPLGSKDTGGARDPLIGAHEMGDGGFEIPTEHGSARMLEGLPAFTRTRGTAYLFYPSVSTLERIARNETFRDEREDDA